MEKNENLTEKSQGNLEQQNFFEQFFSPAMQKETLKNVVKLVPGFVKRAIVLFIFFLAVGTYFSADVVRWFRTLIPEGVQLVSYNPTDVFLSIILVIFVFAIILTFPFALIDFLRYLKPALYEKEKKLLLKILPISVVLFFVGAIFGVLIMAYFGLTFFADLAPIYGVINLWSLSALMQTFAFIGIGFGLAFQLPLVLTFLVRQNLVSIKQIAASRKYVLVGLLFLSAILTPSPDVLSQVLMAGPLYALFEGTLLYLKVSNKK